MTNEDKKIMCFLAKAQEKLGAANMDYAQDQIKAVQEISADLKAYTDELEIFLSGLAQTEVGIKLCALIVYVEDKVTSKSSSRPMVDSIPGGLLCDVLEPCITADQISRYTEEKEKVISEGTLTRSIEEILSIEIDSD